jgi:hypothetical protein
VSSETTLDLKPDAVKAFCERWQVRELALFGSAARGQLRPDSDVDVMVEFRPGETWDLLDLVEMQLDFERIVGRPVDLVEKGTIRNPFRLESIARDITVVYAA